MTQDQVSASAVPEGNGPEENVPRGTLLALLILPAGVAVWLIIWSFGFIASFVSLLIAFGAMFLYRLGAGRLSVAGAIRVAVITIVTLLVALVSGFAVDIALAYQSELGLPAWDAPSDPMFWPLTFDYMWGDGLFNTLVALAFGALGCVGVLRAGFAEARKNDATLPSPFGAQAAPAPETTAETTSAAPAIAVTPPSDSGETPQPGGMRPPV